MNRENAIHLGGTEERNAENAENAEREMVLSVNRSRSRVTHRVTLEIGRLA